MAINKFFKFEWAAVGVVKILPQSNADTQKILYIGSVGNLID